MSAARERSPRIELEGGVIHEVREVVVSESSTLRALTIDGVTRPLDLQSQICSHLIVEVEGASGRICSYVHLFEDPFVLRVSDVTDYCRGHGSATSRILIIEVAAAPPARFGTGPEGILGYLHHHGVLPAGLDVVRSRAAELIVRRPSEALMTVLGAWSRAGMQIVPSRGDLAFAVVRNRRRWSQLDAVSAAT